MTNPAVNHIAAHWPNLWRAGMISVVGRPATSYDLRDYDMEQRRRDLERRAKRYKEKKERSITTEGETK